MSEYVPPYTISEKMLELIAAISEKVGKINGQLVLGDQREIQEVKNAYNAYGKMEEINPFGIADLKKIHGLMTRLIEDESGVFRKGEEGVFSGDKRIFVARRPTWFLNLCAICFHG